MILWFGPSNWSASQKHMLSFPLKAVGISVNQISFVTVHRKLGALGLPTGKKGKPYKLNWNKLEQLKSEIEQNIKTYKPTVVVINDEFIYQMLTGKEINLATARGSTFYLGDIPCVVVDQVLKLNFSDKAHQGGTKTQEKDIRWYSWAFVRDCAKVKRFLDGNTRKVPKFEWQLVDNVDQLERITEDVLLYGKCIAIDIETSNRLITCIGYSVVCNGGEICSYVIPFVDTTKEHGCYWKTEEEEQRVWQCIRKLNASSIPKCFQNGVLYDNSYLLHWRAPVSGTYFDSYQLFHSVWAEAPRTLGFICTIVLDYYHWHKDETDELDAKGDKASEKKWIPQTREGLEIFWEYNALDCYYTLLACLQLGAHMPHWAWDNYIKEFALQIGVGLGASSTGFKMDLERQSFKADEQHNEHDRLSKQLKTMVASEEFNPNSSQDVAYIIYNIFQTPVMKKKGKFSGETTDKRMLKLIADKFPLQARFINLLFDCKEAANNASKYGTLTPSNGRMLYQLNASGTATGRFSSSSHPLKYGTNLQNITEAQRDFLVADPGYVLVEFDYCQSDMYYTAYYLADPEMMDLMEDDRDTHSLMASYFFQKDYDAIMEGKKEKADWVVHPTKGCRQNQKRISYGANYLMAGFTLYTTLGHEATIHTALAMGQSKAADWSQLQLVKFCETLVTKYWQRFHVGWHNLQKVIDDTHSRSGAFIDPWGRVKLFFGNIKDDGVKRKIAAEIGQAGTAGAINRGLLKLKYHTDFEAQGGYIIGQVHDSIITLIPIDNHRLIHTVVDCLNQPLEAHNSKFAVPVEAKLGFSWGRGMYEFDVYNYEWETVLENTIAVENKLRDKYGQERMRLSNV